MHFRLLNTIACLFNLAALIILKELRTTFDCIEGAAIVGAIFIFANIIVLLCPIVLPFWFDD